MNSSISHIGRVGGISAAAYLFMQRFIPKLTRGATVIGFSLLLADCGFSSKPEAKVKGLWVLVEESSAYFWNRSLSFVVYYFDGKGNVGAECRKLWSQGWDANELGCYSASGSYSVKDDVIIIDVPFAGGRYTFKRKGDKLMFSQIGNSNAPFTFTLIKDYPWNTYKDTSRFIRNGKVDRSFFKAWVNP